MKEAHGTKTWNKSKPCLAFSSELTIDSRRIEGFRHTMVWTSHIRINEMLYVANAICSQLKQPGGDSPCFVYTHIYKYIYILFCSIFSCYQVPEMVLLDLFFSQSS